MNCRGKWTIIPFQHVLNGFGIAYKVVHDLDEEDRDSGANGQILQALGGDESRRLTHKPTFEKHVFRTDWTRDKPWQAVQWVKAITDPVPPELLRFFVFVMGEDVIRTPELLAAVTAEPET